MAMPRQCPVTYTSRILGGRWKARIVWALLRNAPMRYSDLRRACPPISDRMLSKELKELEGWDLLAKTQFDCVPPRTEYRLTDHGRSLRSLMEAMAAWGDENQDHAKGPA